jgi:hypothetical protein
MLLQPVTNRPPGLSRSQPFSTSIATSRPLPPTYTASGSGRPSQASGALPSTGCRLPTPNSVAFSRISW